MAGSGVCNCPSHYSSSLNCSDCLYGYYGEGCGSMCPVTNYSICMFINRCLRTIS